MEGTRGAWARGARACLLAVLCAVSLALCFAAVAPAPQKAYADDVKFYGSAYYPIAYDDKGFPLYEADGVTYQRSGLASVSIDNIANAGNVVAIPASFDLITDDGTVRVTPRSVSIGWSPESAASLDMTACATLESFDLFYASNITEVNLAGLGKLKSVSATGCEQLTKLAFDPATIESYEVGGCPLLGPPDFDKFIKLELLNVSEMYGLTNLDLSGLRSLEWASISHTSVESINVTGCSSLETLWINGNDRLTSLDAAAIPSSVIDFNCVSNCISDTDALVARFGENSVLPQSGPSFNDKPLLQVIGEEDAISRLVAGDTVRYSLVGSYRPSSSEESSFWSDEEAGGLWAQECFTVSSTNADVVSLKLETQDTETPYLDLSCGKAGVATLMVSYKATGASGNTYEATQTVEFTVAEVENGISSIKLGAEKVDAQIIADCAICRNSHSLEYCVVPVSMTGVNPNAPVTSEINSLDVTVENESVAYAAFYVRYNEMRDVICVIPRGAGQTKVTVTPYVRGEAQSDKSVSFDVSVSDVGKPTLVVNESLFEPSYLSGESPDSVFCVDSENENRGIAYYKEDAALEAVVRHHGNEFTVNLPYVELEDGSEKTVWEVSSSDETILKPIVSEWSGHLEVLGAGGADVTIKDIWGNEGTCKVTVEDKAEVIKGYTLTQNEIEVEVGEVVNLANLVNQVIDGTCDSGLVFKSADGNIAPIKRSEEEDSRGIYHRSMLLGRATGEVKVTVGSLAGGDYGGGDEYVSLWPTVDFATLTVKVVDPNSAPSPAPTPALPAGPSAPESVTVPVSGDEETIHVGASVAGGTATIDEVDLSELDTVVGEDVATGTVTIDFSGLDVEVTEVVIPSEVVKQISEAVSDPTNDAESLEIVLSESVSIEFDAEALAEKVSQADGADITISVEPSADADINDVQKEAVGDRPAFDINVKSGGKHISDFGGKITVHAPYDLKPGEKAHGIVVWYVDDEGKRHRCDTSYDPVRKRVNWKTDHLSLYMIGYEEPSDFGACLRDAACPITPFDDASAGAWYHDGVHWALGWGVLKGYTDAAGEVTGLGPNDSTTRAQVAVMLHRYAAACGYDVSADEPIPPFEDAAKIGTWAVGAIQWACEKGVLKGYGDGSVLGPNDNVTREQLAVMIHRFAEAYGIDVSEETNILSYADAGKVGEFAVPALQWTCATGIVGGYTDAAGNQTGYLGPKDDASRAQVATMIMRLDALG